MFYFLLLGILVSYIVGRNPISVIQNVYFRFPFLFLLCFGVQVVLEVLVVQTQKQYPFILMLTFVGLLIGFYVNRRIQGIKWIMVGALLNFFALLFHGGLMPVSLRAMNWFGEAESWTTDSRHQLMEDTLFKWLGDWIPFMTPTGATEVLSPGDVLVGCGLIVFMIYNSSLRNRV